MSDILFPEWQTGDITLDESLKKYYQNGFTVSPYGLMIFRRMDWLVNSGETNSQVTYSHLGHQKKEYIGKHIPMLCGTSLNIYSISSIITFVNIEQLNDKLLCEKCCIQAEKKYWLKNIT